MTEPGFRRRTNDHNATILYDTGSRLQRALGTPQRSQPCPLRRTAPYIVSRLKVRR
jgi:hypothetical protein